MIIQNDKLLHFIGGVVLFAGWHFVLTPGETLLLVAAIGFIKEAFDSLNSDKHTAEFLDFAATSAGGLVGYICAWGN